MKRLALKKLIDWKNSKYRKPLVVEGVRQVGKTWLLKEFGRTNYENVAYFDLEQNTEYHEFFEQSKQVSRIMDNLIFASGQKINPHTTLIIFDEVQKCPAALTFLKYFLQDAPEYHVICAGSLLGIALAKQTSFPVGKVNFLKMLPMTFTEFLLATGAENLVDYLASVNTFDHIPEAFSAPLIEKLKMFFVTGGMPEVVCRWANDHDIDAIQAVQKDILNGYERDFAKYAEPAQYPKISAIWESLPAQLSRENKKFQFCDVARNARAREYQEALKWLKDADLITQVKRASAPRLPISAYDEEKVFKLYSPDCGLLRRMSNLSPSVMANGSHLFTEFKGAFVENYVLNALRAQFDVKPRYWSRLNPSHEVDFLIQQDTDIIPVEVKAGTNVKHTSLTYFMNKFESEIDRGVVFSLNNLKRKGDVLYVPLYMADHLDNLLSLMRD